MKLRYLQDDDLLKIYSVDTGKQLGYVEHQTLYAFNPEGYAEIVACIDTREQIPDLLRKWSPGSLRRKDGTEGDRIIGILMAHLAVHEPQASCLKDARKFLKQRGVIV